MIRKRRDLIEPALLRQLYATSDRRGALQAISHVGAIGASGLALHLLWGSLWGIVAFPIHGIFINFLYAGQHELSHGTVFRTRWANVWFGRLFGFIILYPRDFDRIQHQTHHAYTQDPERDGDLDRPSYTLASYLWWLLGPGYWASKVARLARFSLGIVTEHYVSERRRAEVIREARWHMLGYALIAGASIATASNAALVYWLGPMLLTKWVHQLQNAIEHLGLPRTSDMFENTRSTRTNGPMRWLCWNMQYHTAHHILPGVPFHQLPTLDRMLFADQDLEPPRMSYIGFQREVLKALWRGPGEAGYPGSVVWVGPAGTAGEAERGRAG